MGVSGFAWGEEAEADELAVVFQDAEDGEC